MKIEFTLEQEDFLDYHLFTASKSKSTVSQIRNGTLILTLSTLFSSVLFYMINNISMTILLLIMTLLIVLLYPSYYKWYNKRHFRAYNYEQLSARFGKTISVEFKEDFIATWDNTGEGKILLSSVEGVSETPNHFFVKIVSGASLVIPKIQLENSDLLRLKLKELGLTINNELKWKW